MTRVHWALLVLSFGTLQGCATLKRVDPKPVYAHPAAATVPASTKIVRFADALGAVALNNENAKLQSMIAAFDYCDREQRLAFVTPPLSYSPRINYSHVSTYSNRLSPDSTARSFVAPFECIDQKHSVKTGLLESEDIPSTEELHKALGDLRGAVIVHNTTTTSKFRENDLIVKVGGFRIESRGELVKAVDVSPIGSLDFEVLRDGKLTSVSETVYDTTATTSATALKLLEALCKETGSTSPSCARHAFLSAQN